MGESFNLAGPFSWAELGQFALCLSLALALMQAFLPLLGAQRNDSRLMQMAPPVALAQFLMLSLAAAILVAAFVQSDFSVQLVADHSHSLQPLAYKIAASWGNHEGSLLLWVWVLALFAAVGGYGAQNMPPPLRARVLGVQGMIATGFLTFMLLTSNPFARIFPPPLDGRSLNPLLQDPGLVLHPPLLYLGYVGLSMTFSFAVAALIEGRADAAWARRMRPWCLVAWGFLTAGIGLGSWWAYYELGWGGFWFWDPVENASLMPWLAATALLHTAIVAEKRDTMKNWTVLLAILAFGFSLIGTFLVRSGVLTSVHAFATDPGRGLFILLLLSIYIGGALTLYAVRLPQMAGAGSVLFKPVSREGALLLNNWLLTAGLATVLVGTLYPLFLDAVGGAKISVGPPYFNLTFIPMMIPLIIAIGFGPLLGWKRGKLGRVLSLLWPALLIAGVLALYAGAFFDRTLPAATGIGLGAWVIAASVQNLLLPLLRRGWSRYGMGMDLVSSVLHGLRHVPGSQWGMTLAHIGIGLVVIGVTGAGFLTQEKIVTARAGDQVTLGGYIFTLETIEDIQGPNYIARRGTLQVHDRNGRLKAILQPEKRRYVPGGEETTEAAIKSSLGGDLYAAISEQVGPASNDNKAPHKKEHVLRLYIKPFAPFLWTGAFVMAFGAALSLMDRRFRIGVAAKSMGLEKENA